MSKRIVHNLRTVKTTRTPSQIVCVQAYRDSHGQLHISGIAARREAGVWGRSATCSVSTAERWWTWLWSRVKPDRPITLVGYQIRRLAELLCLGDETDSGITSVSKGLLSEKLVVIDLSRRCGNCELIDISNWYDPVPEPVLRQCENQQDPSAFVAESAQNLLSLVKDVIDCTHEYDLGCMQPTIGSWSSNVWRHWYRGRPVVIHDNTDALVLERRAYFGSQVLVRRQGVYEGDWYGVDANMMYPYAMGAWLMPRRLIQYIPRACMADIVDLEHWQGAIASVLIESDSDTYPVKQGGKLLSARGQFWTTLAEPELRAAILRGHVKDVAEVSIYECTDLFGAWMRHIWNIRCELRDNGRIDCATLIKRLATALHGKLGQHGVDWVDVDKPCCKQWSVWPVFLPTGKTAIRRSIGDKVQERRKGEEEPRDSTPAIAAFTTSAGRLYMGVAREIVGPQDWYYQYADSLVVTDKGLGSLMRAGMIDDSEIGRFKVDWTASRLDVRGPGWIMHDDRRRAVGIPPDATETAPDRYNVAYVGSMASALASEGLKGHVASHKNVHIPPPRIEGIILPDGWIDPPCLTLANECTHTRP